MRIEAVTDKESVKYIAGRVWPIEEVLKKVLKSGVGKIFTGVYQKTFDRLMDVMCWINTHGLVAGEVRAHWEKASELLGCKPAYYIDVFGVRSAVWGFMCGETPFVMYMSKEGMNIEIDVDVKRKQLIGVIDELKKIMVKGEGFHTGEISKKRNKGE